MHRDRGAMGGREARYHQSPRRRPVAPVEHCVAHTRVSLDRASYRTYSVIMPCRRVALLYYSVLIASRARRPRKTQCARACRLVALSACGTEIPSSADTGTTRVPLSRRRRRTGMQVVFPRNLQVFVSNMFNIRDPRTT